MTRAKHPARRTAPTRKLEQHLFAAGHGLVAGMDEVGRGALAGPVSVGVIVLDPACGRMPSGVRDSKLVAPDQRVKLVEPIRRWARAGAVGHASPGEIDRFGIVPALCLAGHRALAQVAGVGVTPDILVLDGVHDWLSAPVPCDLPCPTPPVMTQSKGDMRVSAIAAASILAKTERDSLMRSHHDVFPDFGWISNKGYAAPQHTAALRRLGPTELHRRSWRLPSGPEPVQPSLLD